MLGALGEKQNGVSLVSVAGEDGRASKVELNSVGRIRTFRSRTKPGQGFSYSGVTLIKKNALVRVQLPEPPFSIEEGVLEQLAQAGSLAGLVTEKPFIDIGTPDSYRAIREKL
jgi:NDP-sugar pyrophosphorylase family protein